MFGVAVVFAPLSDPLILVWIVNLADCLHGLVIVGPIMCVHCHDMSAFYAVH